MAKGSGRAPLPGAWPWSAACSGPDHAGDDVRHARQFHLIFGILHSIAAASVIGIAFLRAARADHHSRGGSPAWRCRNSNRDCSLQSGVGHPTWIGLFTVAPRSNDFVPLLPWLGPFLIGHGMHEDRGHYRADGAACRHRRRRRCRVHALTRFLRASQSGLLSGAINRFYWPWSGPYHRSRAPAPVGSAARVYRRMRSRMRRGTTARISVSGFCGCVTGY